MSVENGYLILKSLTHIAKMVIHIVQQKWKTLIKE